jgi:glycosyltransferase involved in cell wall biosynthesis
MGFPSSVHILTYDMHGAETATGRKKPCRHTGLVVHTHHLLAGLSARFPDTRWALTQTGERRRAYQLRTPEGVLALAQGVATAFPQHLSGYADGKDPQRVRHFYETTIDEPANPVYRSLAEQYAHVIRAAGTPDVVAQNINPIVSVLKAEQLGCAPGIGRLHLTGVVHDLAGAERRFDYLRQRLAVTEHSVRIVAVSTAVAEHLVEAGVPGETLHTVSNGMDVAAFESRLRTAQEQDAFAALALRNRLPATPMVLMSARRVAWKGHRDLIDAVRMLADSGFDGFHVVVNGHDMHDTRALGYTDALADTIARYRLQDRVFLLDQLSQIEVAACYRAARVAVLPSRQPEAWGYANLEAMLAGTPVITSGHGGPRDYIEHGRSGLLVEPNAPVALAEAIHRLLTDTQLHARLSRQGRSSATRFGLAAMADGYAEILASHRGGLR